MKFSQAGYGKIKKEVRSIAGRVTIEKGVKDKPVISHGWFETFMQRQSQLSYQKGDPTANFRMNCLNREVINDYFALLKDILTEN